MLGINTFILGPIGLLAIIGTTALGWIAISQIRCSAGKIYGMGLAVFDGLLFPLLILDFAIWFVSNVSLHQLLKDSSEPATRALVAIPALSVAVIIAILFNVIIARLVWRAVNKPVVAPAPPAQKPDRFWRWFAVAVFAMIAIPFLISIVGVLAAVAIPNFVKARKQAQENARHAAAQLPAKHLIAQNLVFGPVMERVIEPGNPSHCVLNLGSGNFIEPGPGRLLDFSVSGTNSLRAAGADLACAGRFSRRRPCHAGHALVCRDLSAGR